MKARDFIKKIEKGESVVGYYIIPNEYLCLDFVQKPFTGTQRVWGYYPYKILGFGIKPAGKIYFKVEVIDNIGLVTKKVKSTISKMDWNKNFEFYLTEIEAIEECKLRNRGKKGPGPCHDIDLRNYDENYRSEKYY